MDILLSVGWNYLSVHGTTNKTRVTPYYIQNLTGDCKDNHLVAHENYLHIWNPWGSIKGERCLFIFPFMSKKDNIRHFIFARQV